MWVAGLAMQVMAMLLLFEGSPSVRAADQPSAATAEVKIDNFSFGPQTITVPVGATVTWTNRDDIPHTVVSTDGVFKFKVQDTDNSLTHLQRWERIPISAQCTEMTGKAFAVRLELQMSLQQNFRSVPASIASTRWGLQLFLNMAAGDTICGRHGMEVWISSATQDDVSAFEQLVKVIRSQTPELLNTSRAIGRF
jgi:plastocyanin